MNRTTFMARLDSQAASSPISKRPDIGGCQRIRRPQKFVRSQHRHQPSRFHQGDARSQPHRLAQIVRHEDHRLVKSLLQQKKLALQFVARQRIERTEWLIHEQNLRIGSQRPRHAHPLPLPSRQLDADNATQFQPEAPPTAATRRPRRPTRSSSHPSMRGTSPTLRATVKCGNRPTS